MKLPKIWITHLSVAPWTSADTWDSYLQQAETILRDRLIRLDHRDPVRRVADTRNNEGEFIVAFERHHDRRWVSGRFEKSGVTFSINSYRSVLDEYGRPTRNEMTVIFPLKTDNGKIKDMFQLGNSHLEPFYSYSDLQSVITEKGARHQRLTSGFDIERELPGVFWLTFFGPAYCRFFGTDRVLGLKGAETSNGGGVAICLGGSPNLLTNEREQAERDLAPQSFAGHGLLKREGEFALTLSVLRSEAETKSKSS